jgi:hypothetical protein
MRERGVVSASGLLAGGALGGVFGAALRMIPGFREDWVKLPFYDAEATSQIVSLLAFAALCVYLWLASVKREKPASP